MDQNFFEKKTSLDPNIFWAKRILVPNIFYFFDAKICCDKKFVIPKIFWIKLDFTLNIFGQPKIFGLKICLDHNFFDHKYFGHDFCLETCFGPNFLNKKQQQLQQSQL